MKVPIFGKTIETGKATINKIIDDLLKNPIIASKFTKDDLLKRFENTKTFRHYQYCMDCGEIFGITDDKLCPHCSNDDLVAISGQFWESRN